MLLDPSLHSALTLALEKLIHSALAFDPATRSRLSQLTGILAIKISSPPLVFYCQGTENGIKISSYCEDTVTTQLSGSVTALASLLKQPTNLANSGVEVSGSISLLLEWQVCMQQLDIDWEDAISRTLGDIAGPLLAQGIRQTVAWSKLQTREQQRLIQEYLTEELSILPSKTEVEAFYENIHEMTLALDRFEARLQRIQTNLESVITETKGL